MSYSIFLNYRRDDSSGETKLIRKILADELGEQSVFMDVDSIEPGDEWPKHLRTKLRRADCVIVVIGPTWLQAGLDEWARRRIDDPKDWVRQEIVAALESKKEIIPVLVRGGKRPPAEALPLAMRRLVKKQSIEIRPESMERDLTLLVDQLVKKDRRNPILQETDSPYPRSNLSVPKRLTNAEIDSLLKGELRHWKSTKSSLPEDPKRFRVELFRELTFGKFSEAVRFMNEMAQTCNILNHHPRWENIFKTLRVYLSTWDKKMHRVTDRDVQLAHSFDSAYAKFAGRAQKTKPKPKRG